jgi:hypothetical protein
MNKKAFTIQQIRKMVSFLTGEWPRKQDEVLIHKQIIIHLKFIHQLLPNQ